MSRTRRAKFTDPLQVVETPAMRARIVKIAEAEGISQAEVCRDLNAYGIDWREQLSRERVGG